MNIIQEIPPFPEFTPCPNAAEYHAKTSKRGCFQHCPRGCNGTGLLQNTACHSCQHWGHAPYCDDCGGFGYTTEQPADEPHDGTEGDPHGGWMWAS